MPNAGDYLIKITGSIQNAHAESPHKFIEEFQLSILEDPDSCIKSTKVLNIEPVELPDQ